MYHYVVNITTAKDVTFVGGAIVLAHTMGYCGGTHLSYVFLIQIYQVTIFTCNSWGAYKYVSANISFDNTLHLQNNWIIPADQQL